MLKRTNSTKPATVEAVTRNWHLVDVGGKVLGREATKIARMLQGNNKATFAGNIDGGDYVVVLNAKTVKLTGRKNQEKTYDRYSGYPGGRKVRTAAQLRVSNPAEIIRHAVSGMLPKNKLRDQRMGRLYVFPESTHTHGDKFPPKGDRPMVDKKS